ncbi:MAG TPA: TonB-dependent receptor [Steroidobacteraceae bacterium]|nr:TonB-dependent receptor [Steroidobacteraceae bacterium]
MCSTHALAQSAAGSELTEVIVTATRRSESIQDVPGQVTALTADALSQINARDFADFAAFVPGLSYASSGASTNLIVIRGITTGSQLSSAIGMYLDDVPIGASTSFGLGYQSLDINVFDLNRVEVLNGPQGALYGATSLGGTVKYVTELPNLNKFSSEVGAEVSSTEHGGINHALRAMINLPFGNGIGAVRVDGIQQYDSGYAKDEVYGRDNQGWSRTDGGRISLLLEPSGALNIRLTALTQRIPSESADVGFRDPSTHQPTLGTYGQAFPTFQPSDYRLTLYSGVVHYDLPWAKLTSISGLQTNQGVSRTDESYVYDPALALFGAGTDPFSLYVDTTTKKFTQELRLASHKSDHFEWLLGGYFDTEKTIEVVDLFDQATASGTFLGLPPFNSFLPSTYREYAGYADGTFFLTKRFDIGLGVRYSKQRQAYEETVSGLLATGSTVPMTPPVATSDQGVTTYLINPKYRITDDTMIYARAASGFRPGGPNFVLKPGLGNPTFAPDRLWNYEVGEKSSFLDSRAVLDFDLYEIQWKDIQVTVNNGGVNQLENAGNARVKGAELTFNYRIIPALTLGGSAAYTDARLDTTAPVLGVTHTGARLPLSPRYNFALVGAYGFNIVGNYSGMFTVSDRYVGSRLAAFGTAVSPQYALAAYNLTDLKLAIHAPHGVQYGLYLTNLFDKAGEVSATTLANEYNPRAPVPVYLTEPRTVGLGVTVRFN